jgi:hypothetical protein
VITPTIQKVEDGDFEANRGKVSETLPQKGDTSSVAFKRGKKYKQKGWGCDLRDGAFT